MVIRIQIYRDLIRSQSILVIRIIPHLLATDYYGLLSRCARFLITNLKCIGSRNNLYLYTFTFIFLFNQLLYFLRLFIRICILPFVENKITSMLVVILFIDNVSRWCLRFHKLVGIIWCSCTIVVYWCKTFKCKLTILACCFSLNWRSSILGKRTISINSQSIQLKFRTRQ